jgi:predicted amidohydrolase
MRNVCPDAWKLLGPLVLGGAAASQAAEGGGTPVPHLAGELLRAPRFVAEDGESLSPAWKPWQPEWEPARLSLAITTDGILCTAPGRPYAVGGVAQELGGIEGGRAYRVAARCDLRGIGEPYATVLVRLEWLAGGRTVHPAGVLVRGPRAAGDRARFDDVLAAPREADGARLSLEVKWPRGGAVLWTGASLSAAEPLPPRPVKVGTVYLRPRDSTPERNLDMWCRQIDAAGAQGLDIVCLSEAILRVGTSSTAGEVAEPMPGRSTGRLGEAARRNDIYVVAGLTERDGKRLFNTAVLLDRRGRLVGTYRKVHLPREEWRKGIAPGGEYPVFRTDFGTVGLMICYDWFFPEVAQILALRGAEIVFAPTWGNTLPDREGRVDGRTVFRVRARDSGIYLVPSVYDGESLVVDTLGRVLASSDGRAGVFAAEIDLRRRDPLRWVGHWRSIGPRHRMVDTYGGLGEYPDPDGR